MTTDAKQRATPKFDSVDDIEKFCAEQNEAVLGLADLVVAMDARIKLLTELVECHHEIFIRLGYAKPRPEGDLRVN